MTDVPEPWVVGNEWVVKGPPPDWLIKAAAQGHWRRDGIDSLRANLAALGVLKVYLHDKPDGTTWVAFTPGSIADAGDVVDGDVHWAFKDAIEKRRLRLENEREEKLQRDFHPTA